MANGQITLIVEVFYATRLRYCHIRFHATTAGVRQSESLDRAYSYP
ncbi:Uncharacterised protein [Mycobacteroides abscessus subsp. massiliense]|jgi:hypothetical protein|uniref:Transposase n=1 Tax=Mycobacteroides abscessus subsp. abscessus TaxID=1185650 RepID=A0AB38D209_9MYCO|nr:hypothetical protein [Mycobacteroides abscessus]TDZ95040.1 hypothetical protein CCUG62472_01857 [Mycobacteroides salmoniphilum]SHP70161.1 Uncharacterised protein [Mycobacteroides abscessus subsp. abscessus]SLE85544.1 Uncharacterised protein [Mycobacteroides abscessus subsp. massiliense]CPS07582.1 Uncharacterised protein [Mycobacteroides abscessus]